MDKVYCNNCKYRKELIEPTSYICRVYNTMTVEDTPMRKAYKRRTYPKCTNKNSLNDCTDFKEKRIRGILKSICNFLISKDKIEKVKHEK